VQSCETNNAEAHAHRQQQRSGILRIVGLRLHSDMYEGEVEGFKSRVRHCLLSQVNVVGGSRIQ